MDNRIPIVCCISISESHTSYDPDTAPRSIGKPDEWEVVFDRENQPYFFCPHHARIADSFCTSVEFSREAVNGINLSEEMT